MEGKECVQILCFYSQNEQFDLRKVHISHLYASLAYDSGSDLI